MTPNRLADIARASETLMRELGTGPLAELRRMTPDRPTPAAWELIARHEITPAARADWCTTFRLMASLIPRGDPAARNHAPTRIALGRALADGGVRDWQPDRDAHGVASPAFSQIRMQQLLAARGEGRIDLLARACLLVARSLDPAFGVDPEDIARAVLRPEDSQRLAYPYYRRLVARSEAPSQEDA